MFSEKKFLSCKNKQDGKSVFNNKTYRNLLKLHTSLTGTRLWYNIYITLNFSYIFVHLLFCFLGHCTYKSSHGKALIWSRKVMEIDFSKVVGTMDTTILRCSKEENKGQLNLLW